MSKEVFSNGTEYMYFLETFCYKCQNYGNWEEGEIDCQIELAMHLAINDISVFPHDKVHYESPESPFMICEDFKEVEE